MKRNVKAKLSQKNSAIKYFEFYKVYDDSLIGKDPKGNRTELCDGKRRNASIRNLIQVCSKLHGPGNYAALELANSPNSLALSYWVLKIRADGRGSKLRVIIPDDELQRWRSPAYLIRKEKDEVNRGEPLTPEAIRQALEAGGEFVLTDGPYFESATSTETYISKITGVNIFALQRQKEAGLAATHLKQLKDPKPKTKKMSRKKGRPKGPDSERARELYEDDGQRPKKVKDTIKKELIIKEGIDEDVAQERAEKAMEAQKKNRNRDKKRPKTFKRKEVKK